VVWPWHTRVPAVPPEVPGLSTRLQSPPAASLLPCGPYLPLHHRVCDHLHEWEIRHAAYHQLRGHIRAEHAHVPHCVYPQSWIGPCQWPDEAGRAYWVWQQQDQVPLHGTGTREGKVFLLDWFTLDPSKYGVITCFSNCMIFINLVSEMCGST